MATGRWRDVVGGALVVGVGAWGAWKQLQVVVLVMVLLALGLLYRETSTKFLRAAQRFSENLTTAKVQAFEMSAAERSHPLKDRITDLDLHLLLDGLDPAAFGMLYALHIEGSLPISETNLARVRFLRDRGLIEHDNLKARDSTSVHLSPLGADVMMRLKADGHGA